MTGGPRGRWARIVFLTALLGGCTAAAEGTPLGIQQCVKEGRSLTSEIDFLDRSGNYRLTLVAESGDQEGSDAIAELVLERNTPEARLMGEDLPMAATAPLFGWTDVDLAEVGAQKMGNLASEDPMAPGVLVLQQPRQVGAPSVMIRLGSIANQRDRTAFDGGYTALTVVWAESSGGFGGTWASGVRRVESAGYFCAVRVS